MCAETVRKNSGLLHGRRYRAQGNLSEILEGVINVNIVPQANVSYLSIYARHT